VSDKPNTNHIHLIKLYIVLVKERELRFEPL